jgi:CO/xanthine dehydrogenase FAD-binding subunit
MKRFRYTWAADIPEALFARDPGAAFIAGGANSSTS